MKPSTSKPFPSVALLAVTGAALGMIACSGPEATNTTAGRASAELSSVPGPGASSSSAAARGRRGPDALLERLDKNNDGRVELRELPDRARERWAQADTDGDGILSRAEIQGAMDRRMQERFARADADGDGKLTAAEAGPRMWQHMAVADADADGAVTLEELRSAVQSGKLQSPRGRHGKWGKRGQGGKAGQGGHPGGRKFERFDSNGDGRLQQSEVPEFVWQHLSVADADHDGAVTRDEVQAARQNGKLQPPRGRSGKWGKDGKGGPPGERGKRGGRVFERFDSNGDGRLQESEVPEPVWQHLSAADTDHDGAVTRDEVQAARQSGKLQPPPGRRGRWGGPGTSRQGNP
jgi:Ca2+-binding EF-hand superfamily protein